MRQLKRHETINFHMSLSAIFNALHHRTDTHNKCCIVVVIGAFSHIYTCQCSRVFVHACCLRRDSCHAWKVLAGEDLRTGYTICALGKFVTTYPTGRSHSLCYIYKDSKSRLGLRKCTILFSPAFHFISWAIK